MFRIDNLHTKVLSHTIMILKLTSKRKKIKQLANQQLKYSIFMAITYFFNILTL